MPLNTSKIWAHDCNSVVMGSIWLALCRYLLFLARLSFNFAWIFWWLPQKRINSGFRNQQRPCASHVMDKGNYPTWLTGQGAYPFLEGVRCQSKSIQAKRLTRTRCSYGIIVVEVLPLVFFARVYVGTRSPAHDDGLTNATLVFVRNLSELVQISLALVLWLRKSELKSFSSRY